MGSHWDTDGLGSQCRDCGLEEFLGLHTLNEAHVCACVCSKFEPGDGLLHPQYLCGIRSSNDDLNSVDELGVL
jgi:hypothetical protein